MTFFFFSVSSISSYALGFDPQIVQDRISEWADLFDHDCSDLSEEERLTDWDFVYHSTFQIRLRPEKTNDFLYFEERWFEILTNSTQFSLARKECPMGLLTLAVIFYINAIKLGDTDGALQMVEKIKILFGILPWFYTATSKWPVYELMDHFNDEFQALNSKISLAKSCPALHGLKGVSREAYKQLREENRIAYDGPDEDFVYPVVDHVDWRFILELAREYLPSSPWSFQNSSFYDDPQRKQIETQLALTMLNIYGPHTTSEVVDDVIESCPMGIAFLALATATASAGITSQHFERWALHADDFIIHMPITYLTNSKWPLIRMIAVFSDNNKGKQYFRIDHKSSKFRLRSFSDFPKKLSNLIFSPLIESDFGIYTANQILNAIQIFETCQNQNRLVFTFVTFYGQKLTKLFENLIENLPKIEIKKLFVVAMDTVGFFSCLKHANRTDVHISCWNPSLAIDGKRELVSMVYRYVMPLLVWKLDTPKPVDIFYFDLDTIAVKNPVKFIHQKYAPECAPGGLSDFKDSLWSRHLDGDCVNAGVFYHFGDRSHRPDGKFFHNSSDGVLDWFKNDFRGYVWFEEFFKWYYKNIYEIDQRGVNAFLHYGALISGAFMPLTGKRRGRTFEKYRKLREICADAFTRGGDPACVENEIKNEGWVMLKDAVSFYRDDPLREVRGEYGKFSDEHFITNATGAVYSFGILDDLQNFISSKSGFVGKPDEIVLVHFYDFVFSEKLEEMGPIFDHMKKNFSTVHLALEKFERKKPIKREFCW